jgi:hypothetical protein
MTQTPTNQEILVDVMKASATGEAKPDESRCAASVMRGQRCRRPPAGVGTLCAAHVAMGWSIKDQFIPPGKAV